MPEHDEKLCHDNVCACMCRKCAPECRALAERHEETVTGGMSKRRDTMMRKGPKVRTK